MQALVIDDELQVRRFVGEVLRVDGWQVGEAETAEQAFEMLRDQHWPLVFCDVMLGGADGFTVLRHVVQERPETHIVLMTGYGSAAGALDAVALGAYDYLLKPFTASDVRKLSGAVHKRLEERPHVRSEESAPPIYTSDLNLVGQSAAFVKVMKLVGRLAATNLPVLITGESGTGKEVVARAIHRRSPRASKPFMAVNCGALAAELIESELFGHVRGSFTGADRDRVGLLEEASGGTVFLDEITETSPAFQVKLLRALQEGEIRRVGSNRTQNVDVRIIAATNRDPQAEVERGRFRQDLLYRLNAVSLHLPPLRERREDILSLVKHFAAHTRAAGDPPPHFSQEALHLLGQYPWPGNIRELENAVMHAVALSDHTVRPEDLPEGIRNYHDAPVEERTPAGEAQTSKAVEEWLPMAEVESRYAARVLAHTGGNKQAAARLLGIDRKTLNRMLKRNDPAEAQDQVG